MSVAPGCHRRPPLRMAPLPRPLTGRRNPRLPQTGAPPSAGPHPDPGTQGSQSPLHLSPGRVPTQTSSPPRSLPPPPHGNSPLREFLPPGGHPSPPLRGTVQTTLHPNPGTGWGRGALKAAGALFFPTHRPRWGKGVSRLGGVALAPGPGDLQRRAAAAPGGGE